MPRDGAGRLCRFVWIGAVFNGHWVLQGMGNVVAAGVAGSVVALFVFFLLSRTRFGGNTASTQVTTSAPPEHVLDCVADAALRDLRASVVARTEAELELKVGRLSWRSWGERIQVSAAPDSVDPSSTRVTIDSRSTLRTTVVDWGKNQANVNVLAAAAVEN